MAAAPDLPALPRIAARWGARGPAVIAVAFWVVLPVTCVLGIWLGGHRFAGHVNTTPSGTKGEYYVTSRNCQQRLCITSGTFTSDDGRLVETDLLGDYRWTPGNRYRVVYSRNAADVVPLPGRWDPTSAVVGVTASVALLGCWGWALHGSLRRRRTAVVTPGPTGR